MIRLIASRLVQLPLIVLVIYTVTLFLSWQIPGSPLDAPEGKRPPPEVIAAMEAQYNLDSFGTFYFSYLDNASGLRWVREKLEGTAAMERAAAQETGRPYIERSIFDLGPSLQYDNWRTVEIISGSLPVSVAIGALGLAFAVFIGVLAGVVGAARPGSLADGLTFSIALIGVSLPSFVSGTLLLLIFPVMLGWGAIGRLATPLDLLLPAVTLSLPFAAYIARLTRMGMIEALSADYVRTARAKGCSPSRVLFAHALKNAGLPVLSYLGPAAALALTGSFVVERLFSIPGLGQHFVGAVLAKDLFLIIGVVMVFSTMLIVLNLVVDVLYRWIDPRIS